MSRIVEYAEVKQTLEARSMRCVYHNSGAFDFGDLPVEIVGWIGADDSSIRPAMRGRAIQLSPPIAESIAARLLEIWKSALGGELWLMPASHWAYELNFGNPSWLPEALASIGVDLDALKDRNTGDAVAFEMLESHRVAAFIKTMLEHLTGSDFTLAFPECDVVALLHHHKQIWWTTTDAGLAGKLR